MGVNVNFEDLTVSAVHTAKPDGHIRYRSAKDVGIFLRAGDIFYLSLSGSFRCASGFLGSVARCNNSTLLNAT